MKKSKSCLLILLTALLLITSSCKKSGNESSMPENPSQLEENPVTEENETEAAEAETVIIKDENTTTAGVSRTKPDINIESVEALTVQNSGEDMLGLIRLPLPAGIEPQNVLSASMSLKIKTGDAPDITARPVTLVWDRLEVTWGEIKDYVSDIKSGEAAITEDGWYSIDITDIVKGWLSGTIPNYGLLLEENRGISAFYTAYTEEEYYPELKISYMPVAETYAPFPYGQQEYGNCLSFALRDKESILLEDLGIQMPVLQEAYTTGGVSAAFQYVKDLTVEYAEKNAESLSISSFREIESFDAPINENEYRIALRIGMDESSFDYHLQMQLEDGSWAEKFGPETSRIVPGSNGKLDPGLYPWDQNSFWGLAKWTAYYDSETAYFAVESGS